jgi:glycosyltransferase involved in cell wall biosynthesis
VTYFNERDLLRECLESLLGGADRPDEILIYDNASEFPAKDYIPAGCPVKIFRAETNRGPSFGRNALLHESHSDYIHFQDSDDLFDRQWLSRVRRVIEGKGPDAVFTEISSFRADGRRSEKVLKLTRLLREGDLLRFCLQGPMLVPSGTYKREIVQSIGGYRETCWQSEDFDFHVRLAHHGIRYEVIEDPLIHIRIRPDSRSQNVQEVWTSTLAALDTFSRELPDAYRADLAEAAATTGSMLYRAGDVHRAREAFQLAIRLGPPAYLRQWSPYRWTARFCGPVAAEKAVQWYQKHFPKTWRPWFREQVHRLGWESRRDTFY